MTPSMASSLLVPVHVDAWVVDPSNQELLAWYYADYTRLGEFVSPIPGAFQVDQASQPDAGVHLHWALPDALTHARETGDARQLSFPLVPNRWLIARFTTGSDGRRACKLWVVKSDHLGTGGTSAFLHPFQPSAMSAVPGQPTAFTVNATTIGASFTIEEWAARPDDPQPLFLQAVGPANVAFAAFAPFVRNVFSFTDRDVVSASAGQYTYMIAGWYSDPASGDPLRAITTYVDGIWTSQDIWNAQTPAQRFATLLQEFRWSVSSNPDAPPSTSLYHGAVIGVQWPFTTLGNAGIDVSTLRVAVGETSTDALAALVRAEAAANAQTDAGNAAAWTAAGNTLSDLIEAAMHDALESYGTPGGSVLLDHARRQARYGSSPGGTVWDVVSTVPQDSATDAKSPQLTGAQTAALDRQLAALNIAQRAFDDQQRQLASSQSDLYGMWLRVGRANSFKWHEAPQTTPAWSDLKAFVENTVYPGLVAAVWDGLCALRAAQAALPDPVDQNAANQWMNIRWKLPLDAGGFVTPASLGLALKASTAPRFWHPNDPVVMISGLQRAHHHGEDGRFNEDGTLTCRLPGEIITGLAIAGHPPVDAAVVAAAGATLNPCTLPPNVPDVGALIAEVFFADPASAPLVNKIIAANPTAIQQGIQSLLDGAPTTAAWQGIVPAPFALTSWDQAWAPLFLEWGVHYFPTGAGSGETRAFAPDDWRFDGRDQIWTGTGFDPNYFIPYTGRTLFTPHASLTLLAKLRAYLSKKPDIDSSRLDTLLNTIAGWDVLSQRLGGLTAQLVTELEQEAFPPPSTGSGLACPRTSSAPTPDMATLVGSEYRYMPVLTGTGLTANYFWPVRAGFVRMQQLHVVDAFGQILVASNPNTPQGFQPILDSPLRPDAPPDGFPIGAFQLSPRLVQPARLDCRLLANDGSNADLDVSANRNAICGWLLPNHLDGGLAVYDADGVALGELIGLPQPDNWRPRPGGGSPPATPDAIANATLRAVVSSIARQSGAVFQDLLRLIDETLWMVDPLGGRTDQFLSVLIGRPIAIVQAALGVSLSGEPLFSQLWNDTAVPDPKNAGQYVRVKQTGQVQSVPVPVRLGSLELPEDGLIGYYLAGADPAYSTFYAVHYPDGMITGDVYVRRIIDQQGRYQGGIGVQPGAAPVIVTMLIDPRASVHAYTGFLPVESFALPQHPVDDLMKHLKLTFRTGPIVADPGTVRIPLPAEKNGVWNWVQAIENGGWRQDPIVDADDIARLPDSQLELRDGWLQLTVREDAS